MSNLLNSIILEGVISSVDTGKCDTKGNLNSGFVLSVERTYKNASGKDITEKSDFEVRAAGAAIAGSIQRWAKANGEVRVVGRLKEEKFSVDGKKCSKIIVIAEHIEYKRIPQ